MFTIYKKHQPILRPADTYYFFSFELAAGIKIDLEMAIDLTPEHITAFESHLPGLKEIPQGAHESSLKIKYAEGHQANLELNTHGSVTLTSTEKGNLSPDFLHIFYAVARKAWLKQNLCPVHAACVGFEGQDHVLIVGHAGVGKTSTTLACATKKDMQVFSGDKTIVNLNAQDNQMLAIAGTQVMTLRRHDIERWANLGLQGSGDRYIGKLPERFQSKASQVKVKAVILINLNDGADRTKELIPLSAGHMLYPYFIDTERADVLIDGSVAIFDGTIPFENREIIAKNLAMALKSTPAYHITGSINYITDAISQIASPQKKIANQMKE